MECVFVAKKRPDARLEPAFPTLSLERKWRTRAAPRTSTRADAREHDVGSHDIRVCSWHPNVPPFSLPCGDAAVAACQQARVRDASNKHDLSFVLFPFFMKCPHPSEPTLCSWLMVSLPLVAPMSF